MKEAVLIDQDSRWHVRVVDYLALEHNVTIASAAVFLLGFGEELWKKFLPKYLEALGATTPIIGLFGTAEDFFDACYQYPGGFVADRFGRRRAFLIFIALASLGYLVYLFSTSWPFFFIGLALVMAWQSMASPAIFAVIGDSLPRERRAMGFTLQSILKRVPIVIAPIVGGTLIASMGLVNGVHVGLMITLGLAAVTLVLVLKIRTPNQRPHSINMRGVWRSFHGVLKRLLISDIIIRTCEGMTGVLAILYVTNIHGVSVAAYGTLIAIQMITSILIYIPAGRIADRIGRKPFVTLTFFSFALFPVAIIFASNFLNCAYFAAKINANFPGNPKRNGLPTIQGVVFLCDAENGYPLALMDSIEITTQRTGAATGVAAKYLSRTDSKTMTVCGCGNQGRISVQALSKVLPIERIFAFDTDRAQAENLMNDLATQLRIKIELTDNLETALKQSDVCVTCTPSKQPFLKEEFLAPGTFIAAVGADNPEKQELQPTILSRNKVVTDVVEQSATIGELHHALNAALMTRDDVHAELGEVIAGIKSGRTSVDEIIVFDSTGMALQDVVTAAAVFEKAISEGVGTRIDFAPVKEGGRNE